MIQQLWFVSYFRRRWQRRLGCGCGEGDGDGEGDGEMVGKGGGFLYRMIKHG